MNFDFTDDQKLLQHTARDFLAEHSPLTVCREILETDKPYADDLWKGTAEMGYQGAVIPEEYGGAGFGYLELAVIAAEIGRAVAPIPFASSVYVATEALLRFGSDAQKKAWLPKLASGDAIGTFALTEKPGQNAAENVAAEVKGGKLSGTKLPVLDGDIADFAVVAARDGGNLSLFLVDLTGDGVTRTSIKSFDPSRSQARIEFSGAAAELLGTAGQGAAQVDALLDRAAVLMTFEQVGGAERSLEITREFIMGRYAFGRPIASFQAVKHKMADVWCEVELARSNGYYGAWALSNEAPELGVAACLGRIAACRAYELMTMDMIELHGGVGYTWEYDCHLFYRRAKLLASTLGTAKYWKNLLIDRLQAQDAA
jgi:alkylation response protein AidB-like acyl-CoA dehydrogenase